MHITATFTAAAFLLGYSHAAPVRENPEHIEPCQQVREDVDAYILKNGIVPRNLTTLEELVGLGAIPPIPIRPSLAHACLKSIPLDKAPALAQVDVLRPMLEWHSTLDYLRDPPKGYLSEAVDVVRGLDEIQAKLGQLDVYKTEFDFLSDLYTLLSLRIRDGHFFYRPMLMGLFTFQLGVQFISISKDGISAPDIFLYGDLNHDKNGYKPSPVSTIDGIPAHEFLLRASVFAEGSHDPDTRLNTLLPSVSNRAAVFHFDANLLVLNMTDKTTVKLKNGTKIEFTNTAWFGANFTGISSGSDLWEKYGHGNSTGESPADISAHILDERNYTTAWEKGYPKPAHQGHTTAGFLLNGSSANPELSNVAILAVNSFTIPTDPNNLYLDFGRYFHDFYNIVSGTLRSAKEANKSKLIIDLQSNGGGMLGTLLTLYFSLFPNKYEIFPALWQMRHNEQFKLFGKELFNASDPTKLPLNLQDSLQVKPGPDGMNSNWTFWSSFEEYYGPVKGWKQLGEYTRPSLARSDIHLHQTGYNFTPTFNEPPYRPEDIVLLTDGECASACAIFVDALVNVHGVRTVAMGGRPLEAPMQAIGQTKGGPVLAMFNVAMERDSLANDTSIPDGLALVPRTSDKLPLRTYPDRYMTGWSGSIQTNQGNIIPWDSPNGGEGAIPYQMLYEAANCKLFYTWEMSREIVNVWKAVANVAWNGGKCVKGSTTNKNGTMGGMPKYTPKVEDKYSLGPGSGAVKK
ncbi:hypothetical protein V8F20_006864 [Naviculisporaceae sp. PSN 640]